MVGEEGAIAVGLRGLERLGDNGSGVGEGREGEGGGDWEVRRGLERQRRAGEGGEMNIAAEGEQRKLNWCTHTYTAG